MNRNRSDLGSQQVATPRTGPPRSLRGRNESDFDGAVDEADSAARLPEAACPRRQASPNAALRAPSPSAQPRQGFAQAGAAAAETSPSSAATRGRDEEQEALWVWRVGTERSSCFCACSQAAPPGTMQELVVPNQVNFKAVAFRPTVEELQLPAGNVGRSRDEAASLPAPQPAQEPPRPPRVGSPAQLTAADAAARAARQADQAQFPEQRKAPSGRPEEAAADAPWAFPPAKDDPLRDNSVESMFGNGPYQLPSPPTCRPAA